MIVAKMVLANAKKPTLLQQKVTYLNTLRYKLWTAVVGNNPTGATVVGDFTFVNDLGHPAAGVGPNFGAAILNGAFQAQIVGQDITWVFQYDQNMLFSIFGYAVIDPGDAGKLVYSQVAPVVVQISGPGQTYTLRPLMLDDTMP
jgi:hypothetical protein